MNLFIYKALIWSTQTEHLHLPVMKKDFFAFFTSKKNFFLGIGVLVLQFANLRAQVVYEYAPPEHIKSIQFYGTENTENFPLVSLGEKINLLFDDLRGTEEDYYYKIKHFNHDWTPSALFQNEYLEGYDNLRIDDYNTSFNTLQTYTHYRLQLPNEAVQFKVSGNYLLEIYDTYDTLVFSRRFCLFEEQASVQTAVYRPQNMNRFNTHQSLHFSITPYQGVFRNPEQTLAVHLLQNRQWDSDLTGIKPQYFSGSTLEYRYEAPTQYEGGNEFYFFDTKDLRVTSPNISYIERNQVYETYLNLDVSRLNVPYTFAPDRNGGFQIRNIMRPGNPNIEADYSFVHFSLAADFELNGEEIYIYGSFNNYHLSDANRMYYNPSLEIYEGVLLLKQGFYNYKYVIKQGNLLNKNALSGTHALTENDYLVFVYYRAIGAQYDALIGIGRTNSFELQN